jgi:hypothetical protein
MSVLLFNMGGYRVALSLLQKSADKNLEAIINNARYDESSLIEIRVPLNMPYQARNTEFERHYGEIEIHGISYTYVKRKIDGDVLVLKCIPNIAKEHLQSMDNELVSSMAGSDADRSDNSQQKQLISKKSFSDFDDRSFFDPTINILTTTNKLIRKDSAQLPLVNLDAPQQPPELA